MLNRAGKSEMILPCTWKKQIYGRTIFAPIKSHLIVFNCKQTFAILYRRKLYSCALLGRIICVLLLQVFHIVYYVCEYR